MNDFLLEVNQKQILFKSRAIQDSNVFAKVYDCVQNISLSLALQHAVII